MRRLSPMMMDELLHMSLSDGNDYVGLQMALALMRNQFPWIHDASVEVINILRSRRTRDEKHRAVQHFRRILEFSFEHPMMREMYGSSKDFHLFSRRLPDMLIGVLERGIQG